MTKTQAVDDVKRHLWGWAYRLRETTGITPYDILLSGKIKIKVIFEQKIALMTKEREETDCDILAVVNDKSSTPRYYAKNEDGKFKDYVTVPNKIIEEILKTKVEENT